MVRVLHKAAPRRITEQEAPGISWSTVVASLRLYDGTVSRAHAKLCGQHVVTASGIPSFTGPRLSLLRHASLDERGWSRQDGLGALTVRWPGWCCSSVVQGTGPTDAMVVKGNVAHRKHRRRGENPGRDRGVRLLSPTPQGDLLNQGISLKQAIRVGAGLEG